jgi:uncharacterized Fe-S cluster-containing MiaB family protein
MTYYKASGTCNSCGRYSKAVGSDKEDATLLMQHDHACEHSHSFEGEIVVIEVEDEGHSKR